jgi:hypothetical protein
MHDGCIERIDETDGLIIESPLNAKCGKYRLHLIVKPLGGRNLGPSLQRPGERRLFMDQRQASRSSGR